MRLVIETADNGRMRIWSDDVAEDRLPTPAYAPQRDPAPPFGPPLSAEDRPVEAERRAAADEAADRPPTPAEADRDRRLMALGLSDFALPDEFKGNALAERAWRDGLLKGARSYRRAALETNLIRPDPVAAPAAPSSDQAERIDRANDVADGLAGKVAQIEWVLFGAEGQRERSVQARLGALDAITATMRERMNKSDDRLDERLAEHAKKVDTLAGEVSAAAGRAAARAETAVSIARGKVIEAVGKPMPPTPHSS